MAPPQARRPADGLGDIGPGLCHGDLQRAAQRIQLWQDNKLCSSYYIRFWSSVVKAGDSETFKAKVLAASKRQSAAMMQNTPFSFLMRERS